jgi:glucose/arabinose dehydrogenase
MAMDHNLDAARPDLVQYSLASKANDNVTGFMGDDRKTRGRPVGVTVDPRGALIVADDLSNTIWRVTPILGQQRSLAPAAARR